MSKSLLDSIMELPSSQVDAEKSNKEFEERLETMQKAHDEEMAAIDKDLEDLEKENVNCKRHSMT